MTEETRAEDLVQSHFVRAARAAKSGGPEKRRDWSLFMFFRVMSKEEWETSLNRIFGEENGVNPPRFDPRQFALEVFTPSLWTTFESEREPEPSFVDESVPAQLFLDWLKAATGDGAAELMSGLVGLKERISRVTLRQTEGGAAAEVIAPTTVGMFSQMFARVEALANDASPTNGLDRLREGLVRVCEYELTRGVVRALEDVPVLRSAATESKGVLGATGERAPIQIAFTHSGLAAVGVHKGVLNSFPDVFREGMAARASRLGDVGKSAPGEWDGELGQSVVHGMLISGFDVEGAKHSEWEKLREDIRLFNIGGPGRGLELRLAIGLAYRAIGLEILHLELGQDPYEVSKEDGDTIIPLKHRHEHFGFRDGISQPTLDLPGSGTPSGNGSWTPVAPGEIILGAEDEDKCTQKVPNNPALLNGGTYLVFRKLQQDVAGFRRFIAAARPGSKEERDRLAAQFVGRWPNGASMVRAPAQQPPLTPAQEHDLNNFRYADEDPSGDYCPLGAHVRRTNPRDIGGKSQAKRHRLLRRGMAYGGSLLPDGAPDDGNERGMLFVSAQARIDVQFELIQNRWINGGEFLGQAGLNKCPITGANAGLPSDQFITADSLRPVTGIPRFVHTRGGDYFYAPGLGGLKAIAKRCVKEPPPEPSPNEVGHNSAKTDGVFTPENIGKLIRITLGTGKSHTENFKPIVGGGGAQEHPITGRPIVFVGKHEQVRKALSGELPGIGVPHYIFSSERMFGERILISTDARSAALRKNMKDVLEQAWNALDPYKAFKEHLDNAIGRAVAKTRQVGRLDLVHDLAVDPIYQLVANVYGVPGPDYLTDLATAIRFGSRHISELHPDWLKALRGKDPPNRQLATLQVWSILMFSDLIGNLRNQLELKALGMTAAAQFTAYLRELLMTEQAKPKKKPKQVRTLVEAFCAIEDQFVPNVMTYDEYYKIVRLLLTELVPSALAVIPATFGSVISTLLDKHINVNQLVPGLDAISPPNAPDECIKRLIYEMNRLNPSLPVLQRYALDDVELTPEGTPPDMVVKINKEHWIGALVIAANRDKDVFPDPDNFSLGVQFGGEKREMKDYLMFGAWKSDRECFGRERLAMLALTKFMRAAALFPGLRRVAGPSGKEAKILGTTVGLQARFAPF